MTSTTKLYQSTFEIMKNNVHCLLIDDDTDDKEFFEFALKAANPFIQFHYSASGPEALTKLKSGEIKPTHIFLDLNMMPMDGMECLRSIKQIPDCVDIPVIIYSTTINEDIIYRTLEAGAFDHFEKPTKQLDLVRYLKRIVGVNV